jgi:hypothetical protein
MAGVAKAARTPINLVAIDGVLPTIAFVPAIRAA